MKQKYIPIEKQSKRKQKEYHAMQRRDWGCVNPVTKKAENGKVYNRKKSKQRWCEYEPCLDFLVVDPVFGRLKSQYYLISLFAAITT